MVRKIYAPAVNRLLYLASAFLLISCFFAFAKTYHPQIHFLHKKSDQISRVVSSETNHNPKSDLTTSLNRFASPQVSFEIANTTVVRVPTSIVNPNQITLAVKLSAASTQTVNVNTTLSGTAASGSAYNVVGGSTSLTFNPGEIRKLITLDIVYGDRSAKNLILTLNSPTNSTIAGSLNTHTVNLIPNNTTSNTQRVSFVSSTLSAFENIGGTIKIPVVIYGQIGKKVDGTPIAYDLSGTAVLGTDYEIVGPPNNLNFGPGPEENKGAFIEIRPINNALADGNRTIIIKLKPNGNNGGPAKKTDLGEVDTHIFTIEDDEGTNSALANQPPTATNVTNFTIQNTSTGQIGILPLTGFDPDGTVASYTITVLPNASMGRLYLNGIPITINQVLTVSDAKNVKFELNPSFSGSLATFQYRVTDNEGALSANQATFNIPISNTVASTCQNGKLGPNVLGASGTFSEPYITPNPVVNSVNNGSIAAAPRFNTGNEKPDLTNYNYASASGQLGPEGTYSILKTVGLPNVTPRNPIKGDWIGSDHTGDGGYFMIFNGATPTVTNKKNGQVIGKTFYKATNITICPNTLYEFSAYVLNVLPGNSSAAGGISTQPNISFFINGENVSTSGPIPYSTAATNYNPQWVKVGGLWYSGNSTSISELRIDNASTSASGNDLGIDDISLAICGPDISYPATGNTPQYCSPGTLPLSAEIKSSTNTYSYYIFQYKANGSGIWTDISSPKQGNPVYNGTQYVYTANYGNIVVNTVNSGDEYRVKIATDPANLTGATCNMEASTIVHVTVFDQVNTPPSITICDGSQSTNLTAASTGESWRFVSGPTNATINNSGAVSGMTGIGTYIFELANTAGCSGQTTVTRDDVDGKAGPDINLCSFFTDYKLADVPSGYQWALGSNNPATATINASSGLVNGMSIDGTYRFFLTSDNSTCTDEVLIVRSPCASPVISIAPLPSAVQTEGSSLLLGLLYAKNFGFRVTLNGNYGVPVNFDYKIRPQPSTVINAANDNDIYKLLGIIDLFTTFANATIPNGTDGSYVDINIPIQQDFTIEPDEIFTVEIVPRSLGVNVGVATANGLIINDDGPNPYVSFEFPTSQRREKDLSTNFIKVRLTADAAGNGASQAARTFTRVYFNIDLASTATRDVDYYFPAGSPGALGYVDFPIGISEVLIPINVIDDTDIEPTETVIFNLTTVSPSAANAAIPAATITPSKRRHTFSILDDDRPPIAVPETYQINECDPVLNGTVANGDYDPDGEPITFILGSYDTSKGTITNFNSATGAFTFVPSLTPRFEGPLIVNYKVSDGILTDDGILTIENRYPVLLALNRVEASTCFGSNNGSITLEPMGGTVPDGQYNNYIYNWFDGPFTTRFRTGLSAGIYRVTITDPGTGCSITRDIVVTEAPEIIVDPIKKDVLCYGGNDGEIDPNVSGGTGTFTYLWTYPDATTSTSTIITNLRAGVYQLTVTDVGNSCTKTVSTVLISEPASITANTISASPTSFCTTATAATITGSIPTGGSGPNSFTYKWFISPDNITFNEISGANQQDYFRPSITQTTYYRRDAYSASCTISYQSNILAIIVNTVPNIAANTNTENICSGSTTNIQFTNPNAVTGITYNWIVTPNASITGYSNGSGQTLAQTLVNTTATPQTLVYTVTPSANGCDGIPIIVTITVNPLPRATISGTAVVCLGDTEPLVRFVGSNGQSPYTFTYTVNGGAFQTTTSSGATATIAQSAAVGGQFVYHLISVQDASSIACSNLQSGTATITVNPLPIATINGNATVYVNDPSPRITFIGSDGTAPYTFQYKVNGITNTITTSASSSSISINQITSTDGTFIYELISVSDASSSTCSNLKPGTATVVVLPIADIAVLKTTTNTSYVPGTAVTYTINVRNNGPSTAENVTITDFAPLGTYISSWTAIASAGLTLPASSGTGNLSQQIAIFPNTASATYTIVLMTDANRTLTLSNVASATSTTADSNTSNNTDTTNPIPPASLADVVIKKSNNQATYTAGMPVTYTITAHNFGPSYARTVTVIDNLPNDITTPMMTWTNDRGSSGTGAINDILPFIANGETVTYTVNIAVPASYTGNLTNTASVTSSTTDPDTQTNTDTDTDTPNNLADVVIKKSNNQATYTAGMPVTYTITVHNFGPSYSRTVTVIDDLPANITAPMMTWTNDRGNSGTGAISDILPFIANGETVTYTVNIAVPASYTGNLTNTASVTSTTTDPDTQTNTDTDTDTPNNLADVVIKKSNNQATYTAGMPVTYTITVHNFGPSYARTVTVIDNLPNDITTPMMTWTNDRGNSGTGAISDILPFIANGETVTYTVNIAVPASYTGNLTNTASVTSTTTDPDTQTNTDTDTDTPNNLADVVIKKSNNQATYTAGMPVTYTITVHNFGPSYSRTVTVIDDLPANITAPMMTWTNDRGNSGTGAISDILPFIANGETVTYTVNIAVPASYTGNLTNTASVTSTTTDPDTQTNTDTDTDTPNPVADISVMKTTTNGEYIPGTAITYTINVTNNGPSDAKNVIVTDNAPAGTTITAWSAIPSNSTIDIPVRSGSGNLSSTITSLPNAASVIYTVTLFINPNRVGPLQNTVVVTSTTPDSDTSNNSSTTNPIPPTPLADVVALKTTSAATYAPGTSVTYTINVTNNGPSDAKNVIVTDNAPAGTTITAWSAIPSNSTIDIPVRSGSGNLSSTITSLPNAASVIYTVTLFINPNRVGPLQNTVAVTSTTPDSDTSNNSSTTNPIPPTPLADVVALKTTSATTYVPGTSITYTINVTNNGPSDAKNVIVTDNAPAGTTITAWSAIPSNSTIDIPVRSGSGNLDNTITSLPNAASVIYTVTLFINPDRIGPLQNTVAVTSTTPDNDTSNNSSTTNPIPPTPLADVVALKTTSATTYVPGTSVTYTINVTNNGPSDAKNIIVTDDAPAGTTITSWSAAPSNSTIDIPVRSGFGNLSSTITSLPNTASVIYTVTLFINPDRVGPLQNTVSVTSTTPDSDTSNNSSTTNPIPPTPLADIVTTKMTTATEYIVGRSVTYTINVKNNGPSDARNVMITDLAPAGTLMESWSATSTNVSLTKISDVGNLNETISVFPNGGQINFIVVLRMSNGFNGPLVNTVGVTSTTQDPNPSCINCTTPPIYPQLEADLRFEKVLKNPLQTHYLPGEEIEYLIKITNIGSGSAKDVRVVDTAPPSTTINRWFATASNGATVPRNSGTGNINELIGIIPVNGTVIYNVILRTPLNIVVPVKNVAQITASTVDPTPGAITNPDPTCDTCAPAPSLNPTITIDLSIRKTADTFPVGIDMEYNYTLTVSNLGYFTAHNVEISDKLPLQIAYQQPLQIEDRTISYDASSRKITIKIASLAPRESKNFTFKVKALSLGRVENIAEVIADEPDSDLSNNRSINIKDIVGLKIPDVITPNGDGYNDKFVIPGLELFKSNELMIYNRWGNEVYRSPTGYNNNWDGNGLSGGTYYYVLKLTDATGNVQTIKGYISLLKN